MNLERTIRRKAVGWKAWWAPRGTLLSWALAAGATATPPELQDLRAAAARVHAELDAREAAHRARERRPGEIETVCDSESFCEASRCVQDTLTCSQDVLRIVGETSIV